MMPQLFLFAALLAALAAVLWARRRKPPTQQLPPPGPRFLAASVPPPHPAGEGQPPGPAPRKHFSADEWRNAVRVTVRRGNVEAALTISQAFARERPADFKDPDAFLQAQLFTRLGKLAKAAVVYTNLLNQAVPYAPAYNNRGYTYNLLGEYALAIPDFDRAIALDVHAAYAYNNRGFAKLGLGQPAEARLDIEQGLALDPGNSYAHRNLGIYHFTRGAYEPALACFEHAAQLDQTTPLLGDYLAQTRQQLGSRGSLPLTFPAN